MLLSRKTFLLIAVPFALIVAACSGFAISSLIQKRAIDQKTQGIKLKYSKDFLTEDDQNSSLIVVSPDRLLVPVGDMLYMLDSKNRVVWEYSVAPNVILDVEVDPKGMIYIAVSDGLFSALNASGEEAWSHFMNGSANYTQIKSYRDNGFLVVIGMGGYRAKGSKSEDILQFWKNKDIVWSKEFPQGARLHVWGNKILAVKQTKEGKEITEID